MNFDYILYASAAMYIIFTIAGYFFRPVIKMKRLWLPGYKIIYTDSKIKKPHGCESGTLLKSETHNLRGKPDYVYQKGGRIVPVELKSAAVNKKSRVENDEPREGDVMQLAAYFMIVGDVYKIKPRFGYLVYSDCVYKIRNTGRLIKRLTETINEMEAMLAGKKKAANASFVNCRHCVCRGTVCEHC